MGKLGRIVGAAGATVGMLGAALGAGAVPATAAGRTAAESGGVSRLAGSEVAWTAHGHVLGRLNPSRSLTLRVWLRPDERAATAYAKAASTPGSSAYRHYLTPDQYTARFGPSRATVAATESWLRRSGFASVSADPQRAYVSAVGSAALAERVFRVQENVYRPSAAATAGRYTLYANDRAISLPSALAPDVVGVTGLDDAAPLSTMKGNVTKEGAAAAAASSAKPSCSKYYGQYRKLGLPPKYGKGNFPVVPCGYTAKQLRAAYGANATNNGRGVTIALIEIGLSTNMYRSLRMYAQREGMPYPSPSRYSELSLGRGSECGDPFFGEEQLDVEAAYDMAYKAKLLVVGGDGCVIVQEGLAALFAADEAVLDGNGHTPLAQVASNSWENPAGETQPGSDTAIEHAYLLRAAAEGVSELFSSADNPGVYTPADDPFATGVGGTSLGLGKHNNRLFETGWSTETYLLHRKHWAYGSIDGAAGGGISAEWAEPAYQRGVVPRSLATMPGNKGPSRVIPDISANADLFTAMTIGGPFGNRGQFALIPVGGTSEASPLVAGLIADADQGQAAPLGFLNPALYKLAGTDAIHDTLPMRLNTTRHAYRGVFCTGKALVCEGAPGGVLNTYDFQGGSRIQTLQATRKGYDDMSGIGTPNGQVFINALRAGR
ncbi:MAG TPA: protease pro-enzyme activation domain-containing protein [Acidimicrobiales bacterium]|nr:protease pro-enzyme activation domain-containing protein [Acidimicrobiales bacterium]